jgi:hypothetical protein
MSAGFPLNDGGMFYPMIHDLIRESFFLPRYISYNHANIPFAYPPLAFYVAAFITKFFHADALLLLQYIPVLVSIAVLPAFYKVVFLLTKSFRISLVSLLVFSLTPRSFEWIIMGAGLTRSFGFLFSLLTIYFGYKWLVLAEKKSVYTIAFLSLTMLSHAEWAVFTVYSLLLMVLNQKTQQKMQTLLRLFSAITLAVLLISPWWATVLHQHGVAPFWAALHARQPAVDYVIQLVTFYNYAEEPLMPVVMFLGLLGFGVVFMKKEFLLPAWVVCIFFFSSSSRATFVTIPLAILAGIGIVDVIIERVERVSPPSNRASASIAVLLFIMFYLAMSLTIAHTMGLLSTSAISPDDRQAMQWVARNTDRSSQFLVISTDRNWPTDKVQEWFPALTDRKSLMTVQGQEWLPDFQTREKMYFVMKTCEKRGVTCIESAVARYKLTMTHLYVSNALNRASPGECCRLILEQLQSSAKYRRIYKNMDVSVWKVQSLH